MFDALNKQGGLIMAEIKNYESREQAGEILSEILSDLAIENPYILAIPRGGIQVAKAVADKFKLPINPLVVKKLPSPGNPEAGFGAVTEDGTMVLNENAVLYLGLTDYIIKNISEKVVSEIKRRKNIYGGLNDKKIRGSDVIIIDDGIATGYSIIAGINTIKKRAPKSITLAVPVSSHDAFYIISDMVDQLISPVVSNEHFFAVGNFYKIWFDLSEDEIKTVLNEYKNKYEIDF
jgi:predicted phosphoribosyltransferase